MEGEVRSISFNFIKGNLPRKPLLTSDVINRHKITGLDHRGISIHNRNNSTGVVVGLGVGGCSPPLALGEFQ